MAGGKGTTGGTIEGQQAGGEGGEQGDNRRTTGPGGTGG